MSLSTQLISSLDNISTTAKQKYKNLRLSYFIFDSIEKDLYSNQDSKQLPNRFTKGDSSRKLENCNKIRVIWLETLKLNITVLWHLLEAPRLVPTRL